MSPWLRCLRMLLPGLLALNAHSRETSTWTEPLTGMVFVSLPKACFQMGTTGALMPSGSLGWKRLGYQGSLTADEAPRHQVCLDAFWIGRHEVRLAEWQAVMGQGGAAAEAGRPATGVSWDDAKTFAARLSEKVAESAEKPVIFRLPTEAEWEYACRAGRKEAADPPIADLVAMAWFSGGYRSLHDPAAVGTLKPNAWGLHDLLGNAWEWVEDVYRPDAYAHHALYNPLIGGESGQRVIRGGSYRSETNQIRCGNRGFHASDDSLPQIGFRLVKTQPARSKKGSAR